MWCVVCGVPFFVLLVTSDCTDTSNLSVNVLIHVLFLSWCLQSLEGKLYSTFFRNKKQNNKKSTQLLFPVIINWKPLASRPSGIYIASPVANPLILAYNRRLEVAPLTGTIDIAYGVEPSTPGPYSYHCPVSYTVYSIL